MYHNGFVEKIIAEKRELQKQVEVLESDNAIALITQKCDKRVKASNEREAKAKERCKKYQETIKQLKTRNARLYEENIELTRKNKYNYKIVERLKRDVAREEQLKEDTEDRLERKILTLEEENEALKDEICKLKAQMDHDGTTNGIPTSQTPINKDKIIPNSRIKSERSRGGQKGHKKHTIEKFKEEEITDLEEHTLNKCPKCGGNLKLTGKTITKDEGDYEVKVIKKRHRFNVYKCSDCGKEVHAPISNNLKENNQYGSGIKSLALTLLDVGFVSVNRTKRIIDGMLGKELTPSEGYIGTIQKKAANLLKDFREEVKTKCLSQGVLHWDDTVVFVDKARACFRFYGTNKLALYFAHETKSAEGIEKDGILPKLTEETHLMHDHLKYNYRDEFKFKNLECIAHLERELQKVFNDSGHKWAEEMKTLIQATIHKRKELIKKGEKKFSEEEIIKFEKEKNRILAEGREQNKTNKVQFSYVDERNAILKFEEFYKNYFAWVYDFSLPTTNNVAESGLRMTKSKMKISGQFLNTETADEFALVRTYVETCKRNGVNEYAAINRLASGNPYTLEEITK